jgi:hypothetical protein
LDTRLASDQLEDARHFKKPKWRQLDDDDDDDDPDHQKLININNDKDYMQEQNIFGEDDDDDYDAPVVLHSHTSKSSTLHCMIESEAKEVGYEDHSKIIRS